MSFRVGTASANPGDISFGVIEVGKLADSSTVDIPVILVNGSKLGSTLYLGAAVHGNEITGVEAIRRIIVKLDPKKVSGKIIAVPFQSSLAFRSMSRVTPNDFSPDNLDALFPGTPDGSLTERMAFLLMNEAISKADYVLDLHTGADKNMFVCCISPSPCLLYTSDAADE